MSIVSSQVERAAWMASARLCWLQLEDLRLEITAALGTKPAAVATILLAECDAECERAQFALGQAIDRVKRIP